MKILLLDNYDSFTYNLEHYLVDLNQEVDVIRNDKLELSDVEKYDAVVFSPGPGIPKNAGLMPAIIKTYASKIPMLGICLGMQAIAENYGGSLNNMDRVYHGVASLCKMDVTDAIFENLPEKNEVGRYHSWEVVTPLPSELVNIGEVIADGCLMAIKHKEFPVWGVQFHPESILTPNGKSMLKNWLTAISVKK